MKRLRAMVIGMSLIGASSVLSGQSRQQNWDMCFSHDPGLSITGCSAIIQSGGETDASYAKAFDNRGIAYMQRREYDRAIRDYDQALRLNPTSANAFYNRALTYRLKGDYEHAILDYDQTLRLTPRDPDSFYGRSLAYAHKGDYLSAVADYAQWRWITFGSLGLALLFFFWVALVFAVGEMLRKGGDQNVRPRRCMGWIFAAEACKYLEDAHRSILNTIHQRIEISASTLAFSLLVAFVSGLAWWTVWRNKSSAKGCAVAASLIQVVIFVRQFIPPLRPVGDYHAMALIVGVGGLFIFLGRDRRHPSQPLADEQQSHLISLFEGEAADANSRNYS